MSNITNEVIALRILLITHFFPPEQGAAQARLFGLAKYLVSIGHQVEVITGMPNYPDGIIQDAYRGRFLLTETIDGLVVHRVWHYVSPKKTRWRRIVEYLSLATTATLAGLVKGRKVSVIMASSPPLFIGIPAAIASLILRRSFVLDVRDLWPEMAILVGELRPNSLMAKFGSWLEHWLYRRANCITVVTPLKQQKIEAKHEAFKGKIFVAPNGFDQDFADAPFDSTLRQELGLHPDDFVVIYAGLIGLAQGTDMIIRAAARLKGDDHVKFVIVGGGPKREELVSMATNLNVSNITFIPPQPKSYVRSLLAVASVAVVPLKSATMQDSVPSKLYDYMACGCPVVLAAEGEAAALVRDSGGGLVVQPGDDAALCEALVCLRKDAATRSAMGERGRVFIRRRYSRQEAGRVLDMAMRYALQPNQTRR